MATSPKLIHNSPRQAPRCYKGRLSSRCFQQKADFEPCVHVERKLGCQTAKCTHIAAYTICRMSYLRRRYKPLLSSEFASGRCKNSRNNYSHTAEDRLMTSISKRHATPWESLPHASVSYATTVHQCGYITSRRGRLNRNRAEETAPLHRSTQGGSS